MNPESLAGRRWKAVTLPERDYLAGLYTSHRDLSEYAAVMSVTLSTFERNCRRHIEDTQRFQLQGALDALPRMPEHRFVDHLELEADDCIISSDWEIPNADPFFIRAQLMVAYAYGIRSLILDGDIIANDHVGINKFAPIYAEDEQVNFGEQRRLTRELARAYSKWFEFVGMVSGNHERKLNKATQGQVSMEYVLEDEGLTFTRYAHMWLKTSRGYAYINHPKNYNRNPIILGKQLYNNTVAPDGSKPRYVVLGHTHQSQSGFSDDNQAQIFALGCVRHPDQAAYANREVTNHPRWAQSFLMIKDGIGYQFFDRRWTDYEAVLGKGLSEELFNS